MRESDNPKWKDRYTWSVTAARACWILHNCLPWMMLKNEQAKLLLELQDDIDHTLQGRGRRLTQEQIDKRVDLREKVKFLNLKGPRG